MLKMLYTSDQDSPAMPTHTIDTGWRGLSPADAEVEAMFMQTASSVSTK